MKPPPLHCDTRPINPFSRTYVAQGQRKAFSTTTAPLLYAPLKSFLAFILQCWHTARKLFCIQKSLQNSTFPLLVENYETMLSCNDRNSQHYGPKTTLTAGLQSFLTLWDCFYALGPLELESRALKRLRDC